MSGSPKYSIFDLTDEVAQMLQVKHEIAMKKLAAYRQEEEKRRKAERLQGQLTGRSYNQRERARIGSRLLWEQISDRVAGLKTDPFIMRWMQGDVAALAEKLAEAAGMSDRDDWAAAQNAASDLLRETERVVEKAEAMQLAEDRRQYVIQGIMTVMENMGFVIQTGYPAPEYPGFPSSATIIQASRLGGGDIALSVPQQGEIWYEVNGFPMQTEESSTVHTIHSCDQAENEIEKIHDLLEVSYGIQMGELRWEGKDPHRIRKTARDLPGFCGDGCKRVR